MLDQVIPSGGANVDQAFRLRHANRGALLHNPNVDPALLDPPSVLVACADRPRQARLARALTRAGYVVRTTSTGNGVLRSLGRGLLGRPAPELVVLASDLGEPDALDVLDTIHGDTWVTPVIVLGDALGTPQADHIGADEVVADPDNTAALVHAVRRLAPTVM